MINTKVDLPGSASTPVRKSARRLRWFKETLHRQIENLEAQTNIEFEVNDVEIRALFLRWLEAFEAQKPTNNQGIEDFVSFASGLMLRELIKSKPLKAKNLPEGADQSNPAYFWPEGYLYVALCLNIRSAVLEQDFDVEKHISPNMDELRTWWSFKENISEDPNLAIGFFDLFAGVEPSWEMPAIFSSRKGANVAQKYFASRANNDLLKD